MDAFGYLLGVVTFDPAVNNDTKPTITIVRSPMSIVFVKHSVYDS